MDAQDWPLTPSDLVAQQREAFLPSPGLDPAWIAGWHAAIDHATAVLARAELAEEED